jgi:K+-dependent Na+/Ca+ exchanger-like protein
MVLYLPKAVRKSAEFKSAKQRARVGMVVGIMAMYMLYVSVNGDTKGSAGTVNGRRLSSGETTCTAGDIGSVILYAVLILYSFLGLAIVCDDWFVPALEKISEQLNLSADVAGATFLAAGSSAPELFTSMADTFGPGNNIGLGTIVGSAMFNILIIVAMAAAATTQVLDIDWRPVVRDCGFYSLSILELVVFFDDGQILWWEGLIMTLTYGLYITFMIFNEKIFSKCATKKAVVPTEDEEYQPGRRESTHDHKGLFQGADRQAKLPDGTVVQMEDGKVAANPGDVQPEENNAEEEEESYWHRFDFPKEGGKMDQVLWVFSVPFYALFSIIPDCSHSKCEKYYLMTFILSIGAIGGLCHVMVVFASGIGCILQIDPFIMGTMVLAVGTSVPDALGSMIVARAGEADMAIANAVGSNVFDILLGLGFPWFLKGLMFPEQHITVRKCGSFNAVIILFSTVILFFLILIVNKWKMTNKLGSSFIVLYVLYMIYNILKATGTIDESAGCAEPYCARFPDATIAMCPPVVANSTRL